MRRLVLYKINPMFQGILLQRFALKIILISVFLLSISSCVMMPNISDEMRRELQEKNYPIAILYLKTLPPNSAGGVDLVIVSQNMSLKDIKYVVYTVTPYNRVNDPVESEIGRKSAAMVKTTGPFVPGEKIGRYSSWKNVWYNPTIVHVTIDKIVVIFIDNTEVKFNASQVSEMIINRGS